MLELVDRDFKWATVNISKELKEIIKNYRMAAPSHPKENCSKRTGIYKL